MYQQAHGNIVDTPSADRLHTCSLDALLTIHVQQALSVIFIVRTLWKVPHICLSIRKSGTSA
jgi:hypothetical protein